MKNNSKAEFDVAIAGMGPTGLVLAHMLGMRGHDVIVLEREPVFYGNARAVYTDDECMRIFQHIGAADEIAKDMLQETPVQFVRPDGSVLGQYCPRQRPFGWPVVNFFYQPYLETTLTKLLERYPNVVIQRGREVCGFEQDSNGVNVTHQATREFRYSENTDGLTESTTDSDLKTLRARYLVGADGGRSFVRETLGIKMTGRNFPEPWLVVDLKQKDRNEGLRHLPYFNFVVDPKLPVVSCIQPDGFHRFEFMLKPDQTKEYMEKPETVREYLSKFIDPDKFDVMRKLVYTFNALIVEKWHEGRVILAGDAAHMTPQFMGQGASSGVRDAFNLGWKLSAVLQGCASEKLLDTYGNERHDHAQAMINISVFLKDLVSTTHPVGSRVRDTVMLTVQKVPGLKKWVEEGGVKPKPIYTKGQYLGLPRGFRGQEGTMAPQPEVRLLDGRHMPLDELTSDGFTVIGLNVDPRKTLSNADMDFLSKLNTRYIALYPYAHRPQGMDGVESDAADGLQEAEDMTGSMVKWFRKAGFRKHGVAILRPDKFTFAMVKPEEQTLALEALQEQMGWEYASPELKDPAAASQPQQRI
ncbi:bifunctional 3-(3-hydroxy-phenyl)propionate/3-hydroxycinnamic acid hydroxylase [Alcanivorax sp.]|jgi:3-(3-hydroxy-phenyl)propionate hydroxylase|uniref:bifunctional 3-(3-hydroxy-phenyl)propionate/3-hydroxycinnamic acid hydroxylase MhpA n=1 Tax=Alcanivorax sp. TaxID=1872427 RepID=UPI0032D93765